MLDKSYLRTKLTFSVVIILFFFGLHHLIQQPVVYNSVFKPFMTNFEKINGANEAKDVPYAKISNRTLSSFDADIYRVLKEDMYEVAAKENGDFVYASFPLYPLLWKLTHLPAWGMTALNLIFLIIASLLLSFLFCNGNWNKWYKLSVYILLFTIPGCAVFYVPYSEALFMILVAVAIWGNYKKRYIIYFTGFLLASMTRSASVFLLSTFFVAELLVFFENKKLLDFIKSFLLKIAPVVAGTFLASLIQYIYGSGSLLKFIEIQKYWGYKLAWPSFASDWTLSSFGQSIGVFFFIIPVVTILLFNKFIKGIKIFSGKETQQAEEQTNFKNYWFNVALSYTTIMFLFILFYKGGNLYGTTRYIVTSPFFLILAYVGLDKLTTVPRNYVRWFFGAMLIVSMFFMSTSAFAAGWNFFDLGYCLLAFMFGFLVYFKDNLLFKTLLFIGIIFNILWATYLFNMVLTKTWISI
ncbi:MAG: hypothetical protein V2A54_07670 [Bacteroidota bacterium]